MLGSLLFDGFGWDGRDALNQNIALSVYGLFHVFLLSYDLTVAFHHCQQAKVDQLIRRLIGGQVDEPFALHTLPVVFNLLGVLNGKADMQWFHLRP
jgi:hypothetical protein